MFTNENAKVNYLDIDGKGIPMLRQAIMDQHGHFEEEGGRLLTVSDRTQPESGEALRRRQAAQQMTLKNLVINAGNGLQDVLRKIASVMGIDPELVRFVPDTDFAEPVLSGLEMTQMQAARVAGAPWAAESFHEVIRRGGRTGMTFEEEMESIDNEPPLIPTDVPPEAADGETENEDE